MAEPKAGAVRTRTHATAPGSVVPVHGIEPSSRVRGLPGGSPAGRQSRRAPARERVPARGWFITMPAAAAVAAAGYGVIWLAFG
ncbi:hypothetical protein ACWDR0_33720, partial [Streptomyces sp. NPDC003691]